ncbi:DUF1320 domain-containing protein [Oleomonas cavernae]|uniref:DUF1320 domain-containing protein n=1 Tax=Oleomonas cavernae TaxID=2320859 RepID=A0A418WUF3_9PROT|nr:DUF1320 domain-containing protein [Oleomonas cavernae]RJF94806.1 DUF1320 domain-containing protein [Oleomonas cavernae]
MSYATLDDLVERAGAAEILQIADRDNDDIADPAVIAAAIDTAGQTIDAYLAIRYLMPLSTVPSIVLKWAVSIARYHLHRDGAPDHVVRDYKDALAELRDAAAGRLLLPDLAGITPQAGTAGGVQYAGSDPVFTDANLEGFL